MIQKALNYNWQFIEGFEKKYLKQPIKGSLVDIPHTVKEIPKNYFDQSLTEGVFTYQKAFDYSLKNHRRLFVTFEGVMSKATVYLNGKELSHHVGGYTRFKVELTEALKESNLLTVRVDSHESSDHPPFGNVIDYLTYGGIYREVSLIETGPDLFEHVLIDGDQTTLNIRAKLNKHSNETQCRFEIYDEQDKLYTLNEEIRDDTLAIQTSHNLTLWDIDNPKRYTLKGFINDQFVYETKFGIRTISVDRDNFYLNGKKVFLRGLNRHQSYPYVGYAMPASAQKKDADILKYELGVNIVRSSHYPPSRHFLDRCDEIGLLVFTELPGWQHIGDETWKTHALSDLKSLVIDDYNHPSIVIIGTRINESSDDHDFYTKTRDLVKSIDQSRPTGGVRFFGKSELLEDIYTVNDFVHRGDNEGLTPKKKMTKEQHPYLITEYNGHMFPTKSFDDETKRVNHALRHFKVLDDAYRMQGVMGAIGWCMNDYNTHKEFGSNDHICYHGVLDMNRNSKYAAAVYASHGDKPYMNVLSMMHIGERPAGALKEVVIATNCEKVEVLKNGKWIGTHYPSKRYKHLPHPPIIINDFVGNQIVESDRFSKRDAKRIKAIMLYMLANDLKMRLRDKLLFGYILLKYKMKYQDAVELYTKYVGGWGEEATHYTFKGYIANDCVATVHKGTNDAYRFALKPDAETLYHGDTYDVTRVTIEHLNGFDERAFYSNETLRIEALGSIELIGPSQRNLQGGIESFWIRSTSEGSGTVYVYTQNNLTITQTFEVVGK